MDTIHRCSDWIVSFAVTDLGYHNACHVECGVSHLDITTLDIKTAESRAD